LNALAIDFQGEYAFLDESERLQADLGDRPIPSRWRLGQMILSNHSSGRFRTRVVEPEVIAGSSLRLKVEGITPYAVLAIVSGRLDHGPLEAFGRIVIPYGASLDAVVRIPPDAEGGTYIFFAQQWEPDGTPGYPGGSLIYPSGTASVKVHPRIDDEAFWESFQTWSSEDAEEVRENIRKSRERPQGKKT
jgi:hypothetical protein